MEAFRKSNRSAFLNFVRAKYEMYRGAVEVSSYPYYMSIDPSDKCQLRCTTCPTGIENEGRRGNGAPVIFRKERAKLQPELFDAVLDELGEYLFQILFYNYGEPLLNPHIAQFIRKATERNIDSDMHTNLSLSLSDERIDELMGSGLGRLNASVDGFSQETYEIHRVGGDFELVKSNLIRLAEARNRLGARTEIAYNFLVFSFNEHELADVRRFCDELGIDFIQREAFVDDPDWLPSYRRGEEPWRVHELAQVRKGSDRSWSPLPAVDETKSPRSCGWHYGYTVLTAGGPLAPCCPISREEHDFGTVAAGKTTFAEVWNGERYRKSRADFAGTRLTGLEDLETICTHCPYSRTIQHLYSPLDEVVLKRFHAVFHGVDEKLERAFDLLSRIRFGVSLEDLVRTGRRPDYLFVGNEGDSETGKFVEFVENNLIETPSEVPLG